ncbi:kinesin-like protein KIN-12D isoform X1 [Coffea arabica]|uniref:Kinesin-like protein KIN-12D isoform X1 n=2 Tax=Coffea arabica TaxID=13443 RepID=A0A6P6WEP5_COFAR|nr:kinesin-like protein KIN-12D isoform X1 [Coffea arabica]
MLRDLKFLRRNTGKDSSIEDAENVPLNPKDSLVPQIGSDSSSRPPLNVIQEPAQVLKGGLDQEMSVRASKTDRTPTKSTKATTSVHLRTPEKQGKNRFGWAQKSESSSNAAEMKGDGNGNTRTVANVVTPRSTRTMGRANNSSYSECNSTQSTPTKSVSKPQNPGFCLASGSRPPPSGGARMSNFAALSKGIPISCNSVTVVNSVEVPHFEPKEDPSFWLEHNVQVLIRVRPLSNAEKSTHGYSRCLKQESAQTITWIGQPETRFTFDHVACESIDQETLFRLVGLSMVENCLSGYNSCMFAYGQTGSGKTHTMLGDIDELEIKPSLNRGMTPRIFEFLFARIRAEQESRKDEKLRYHCKCSFLEIYNEQISDLLDPSSTNLQLREDIKKGVYVENLSEFEVQTVGDILRLLRQGSSNRKVAATNMNRESSRSHSVFTCEIESSWEKDSTCNFRFARLNLVDLAGSERQKTSGAEGERLKEAANINKSLSTLGHVIMVLVDVANGRPRHIPYRDSRLTFLLQDSLGGNSKTMIIANVSPSICSAAETLNTLKFAQRAKLIQNNAVVNEDTSGDVVTLQNQIRLLKEELSVLKHQNVSRALTFGPLMVNNTHEDGSSCYEEAFEIDQQSYLLDKDKGSLRLSTKQFKSLETTLAGALRREQMAEISIKQLEAEIEQLNRLVRQREEDTRCTKMMLKFREDKIQRLESLLGGLMPTDAYLLEENRELSNEVQLLRAKVEKNPEVTRFALENIRLLEQLRRFQDFYEEGEREMLSAEVSELRDQLIFSLDGTLKQLNHLDMSMLPNQGIDVPEENDSVHEELKRTLCELEECRTNLNRCLEYNAKLSREVEDLHSSLSISRSGAEEQDGNIKVIKESITEAPSFHNEPIEAAQKVKKETWPGNMNEQIEEVLDLQLELDILKVILKEERSYRQQAETRAQSLNRDLSLSKEKVLLITKQCDAVEEELKEAKSIIEALESQQILVINELEELRNANTQNVETLHKQKLELSTLKEQTGCQDFKNLPSTTHNEDCSLEEKLNKMHASLEKANRLNKWYQSDRAFQASNEEQMDEVRRQVEAETAEVIVCLQEELYLLQQEVQAGNEKEMETKESLAVLQTEIKELQEKLSLMTQENTKLSKLLENKENELAQLSGEWDLLTNEIEAVLQGGHESLKDASDQLTTISSSFPQKSSWISAQFGRMAKHIFEKELLIEELNHYLDVASSKRNEMECMLSSLRGAALVMTEVHQQECSRKDKEIIQLSSQLTAESSTILELNNRIKHVEDHLRNASTCATVAFVIVNRLSELNSNHLDALKHLDKQLKELVETNTNKDCVIQSQASIIGEAEKQVQSLKKDLEGLKASCSDLSLKLSEEQKCGNALRLELEDYEEKTILKTGEKLTEFKNGVSEVRSYMKEYVETIGSFGGHDSTETSTCFSVNENDDKRTGMETKEAFKYMNSCADGDIIFKSPGCFADLGNNRSGENILECQNTLKDVNNKDATIMLLKKEIESALESLNGVQAEMSKLRDEKDKFYTSEKEIQRGIECIVNQVVLLQNAMDYFEEESKFRIDSLEFKLHGLEEIVQHSCNSWIKQKELLEAELGDARAVSTQKDTEASCILAKFEEVQDTMKDADIMINELMIANETLKLEVKELRKKEVSLICDSDSLIRQVQSLQIINDQKNCHLEEVERQLKSDFETMKSSVMEMELVFSQVQTASIKDCLSVASDCLSMRSYFHDSIKLMSSCLEDIWSEIIIKDSAVSVLHLCHLGILLETVTGLNAENGLLSRGFGESNAVISELREQNIKSRRELESCRSLEGKLLADIKNSFDRISRKEDETGELSIKLTTFEQKIMDLQFQEELMLQRSNHMGSELAVLMKELDLSNQNVLASFLDRERLLKKQEEVFRSQQDNFIMEMSARDFEFLIMSLQLEQVTAIKADIEKEQQSSIEVLETFKEDMIFQVINARVTESILLETEEEHSSLQKEFEVAGKELQAMLSELDKRNATISQMEDFNRTLLLDAQSLNEVASLNDKLKGELDEEMEAKKILSFQVEKLNAECQKLIVDKKVIEAALELSSGEISTLQQQNQTLQSNIVLLEATSLQLQNELQMNNSELSKFHSVDEMEKSTRGDIAKLKAENSLLLQELEEKKAELISSLREKNILDVENKKLEDFISSLENQTAKLQIDMDEARAEVNELRLSQSVVKDVIKTKSQDLQIQVARVKALQEEKALLRGELRDYMSKEREYLNASSSKFVRCVDSVEYLHAAGNNICSLSSKETLLLDDMFQELCVEFGKISRFLEDFENLENLTKELASETASLETELLRKDEILGGLLFDMSLLQESASNSMDHKDEIEALLGSISSLEDELQLKSDNLNEAVARGQELEAQLQEKMRIISCLELDIAKEHKAVRSLKSENLELIASIEDALEAKKSMEEELVERRKVSENLETEVAEMGIALAEMNIMIESLKCNLNDVTVERDDLHGEMLVLKKGLEMARISAEENGALAAEAQEMAEISKVNVEGKEQEVKLLERSVEELECTVNVLENKVEILKGEAERQRLQREELEMELQAIRQQMHSVKSCDSDMKRKLDEKEKILEEALQRIQILEREIAAKDAEISRCRGHISELNLHAEAQASEYKQKFKVLEAMLEQVKQDVPAIHASANKLEKNASKSRGSGSPFKCIGLGLVQQIKSEKDEELSAGRHRIEELEALAASRQKEIFMLNARLAAAESMTHDVIRDLLGLKLDMNSCANLLDNQQLQMLMEKAQLHNVQEQEVAKLKQQLNEFIKERKGWIAEIDRKQAEMVTTQVAVEKLRQRDQLLTTENEMLKMENLNYKKRTTELDAEVKKLSGQQNLQQRIHHHAKIKEENNILKRQNDELSVKLRKSEALLSRVKQELAQFRIADGRSPCINFDEEQRLNDKLMETETERFQLAQELVSLCTSILKAAGITRPTSEVNLAVAEEALDQLKNRVNALETELEDVKLKNRMNKERIRLSELMPETSTPLSSRTDPRQQPTLLSAFDR